MFGIHVVQIERRTKGGPWDGGLDWTVDACRLSRLFNDVTARLVTSPAAVAPGLGVPAW